MTECSLYAKLALLRVLTAEMTHLTGRFLSEAEQLRALSIGEEIDRLEDEVQKMENNRAR